jgi:multiple antibiotic resistance protein
MRAAYVLAIFMVTLGPIKTVPAFFVMTKDLDPAARRRLAVNGALAATAIALLIALVLDKIASSWGVGADDLLLAGGILLFLGARDAILHFGSPPSAPPAPSRYPAVAPLAIPTIITPWGVVAILVFMTLANGDPLYILTVLAVLIGTMILNLAGMLLAPQIVGLVGIVSFQVAGWIFSVLQAGLAVDFVAKALKHMNVSQPPL